MAQVKELYVDDHRKAVINKIGSSMAVVVLDSIPRVLKRELYEETISFREIDIVKRRLNQRIGCGNSKYRYTVIEEALCIKNQEDCVTISYIINIECLDAGACEDKEIVGLINCIESAIKA